MPHLYTHSHIPSITKAHVRTCEHVCTPMHSYIFACMGLYSYMPIYAHICTDTYTKTHARLHSFYINSCAHNNTYAYVHLNARTYTFMQELTQSFTCIILNFILLLCRFYAKCNKITASRLSRPLILFQCFLQIFIIT